MYSIQTTTEQVEQRVTLRRTVKTLDLGLRGCGFDSEMEPGQTN